jgi:hypothetical protein
MHKINDTNNKGRETSKKSRMEGVEEEDNLRPTAEALSLRDIPVETWTRVVTNPG